MITYWFSVYRVPSCDERSTYSLLFLRALPLLRVPVCTCYFVHSFCADFRGYVRFVNRENGRSVFFFLSPNSRVSVIFVFCCGIVLREKKITAVLGCSLGWVANKCDYFLFFTRPSGTITVATEMALEPL